MVKKTLEDFKNFIARGNVVDLAVGIIMGTAFTAIVNSLVNDIIMPPIGVLIGGIDFANLFIPLQLPLEGAPVYKTVKAAQEAGVPIISYGVFLNAIIKFVIVSAAVFVLVKQVSRLNKPKEAPPSVPAEPVIPADIALLTEIRDLLKK